MSYVKVYPKKDNDFAPNSNIKSVMMANYSFTSFYIIDTTERTNHDSYTTNEKSNCSNNF